MALPDPHHPDSPKFTHARNRRGLDTAGKDVLLKGLRLGWAPKKPAAQHGTTATGSVTAPLASGWVQRDSSVAGHQEGTAKLLGARAGLPLLDACSVVSGAVPAEDHSVQRGRGRGWQGLDTDGRHRGRDSTGTAKGS